MSNFGDIAEWVKTTLETEVAALTKVVSVVEPEELSILARNTPAAGVMVIGGDATGEIISDGTQNILVDVGIWVSAKALRGGSDLTKTNNLYDLFDDIYAEMKNQIPTGGFSPLRYIGHEIEIADSNLAIMAINYRTSIVI